MRFTGRGDDKIGPGDYNGEIGNPSCLSILIDRTTLLTLENRVLNLEDIFWTLCRTLFVEWPR